MLIFAHIDFPYFKQIINPSKLIICHKRYNFMVAELSHISGQLNYLQVVSISVIHLLTLYV